ncbi:MAG: DUF6090 family protein [Marinicella sp.]|nr:hypothetical protein [Xanthomonadales bacterium]
MLLRRITEHIKNQNWFAVFLDFVIVVLGVFIGIQVANWNEARFERKLSDQYLNSLSLDLQRDLQFSEALSDYYEEVLLHVIKTDELLNAKDAENLSLVVSAYRASEVGYSAPRISTWEQVVSSGHLGLLPQEVIDSGLSEYYEDNDSDKYSYNSLSASAYRKKVRSLIPLPVQLAIRTGCSDVFNDFGIVIGFTKQCEIDVPSELIDEAAANLKESSEVRFLVRFQYSLVYTLLNNISGNNVNIKKALNTIYAIFKDSE